MQRLIVVIVGICAVFSAAAQLRADEKDKSPSVRVSQEKGSSQVERILVQESSLEWCTDGQDNDGDGYLDCDDQDCGIYAVCLEKETPKQEAPKVIVVYETMDGLKKALRRGEITGREFHRQWGIIRANRARELAELRVEYKEGNLTRREYRCQAREIKRKYEGD